MWYPQFKYSFSVYWKGVFDRLIRVSPGVKIEELQVSIKTCTKGHFSEKIPLTIDSYKDRSISELDALATQVMNENSHKLKKKYSADTIFYFFEVITQPVAASATARVVLPKFKPQEEYVNNAVNDKKIYAADIENLKQFLLDSHLLMGRQPVVLSSIKTKTDVWKLLNLAYKEIPFMTAIDLPSLGCVMLLSPNYAFSVSYNSTKNSIRDEIYPAFDIDDGFVASPFGSIIGKEMQDAYKQWIVSGTKSPILPLEANTSVPLKDSYRNIFSLFVSALTFNPDTVTPTVNAEKSNQVRSP